jgi:hypothetical protein
MFGFAVRIYAHLIGTPLGIADTNLSALNASPDRAGRAVARRDLVIGLSQYAARFPVDCVTRWVTAIHGSHIHGQNFERIGKKWERVEISFRHRHQWTPRLLQLQ